MQNDVQLIDAHALVKDLRLMAKYQPPYKCSTIMGVCSTIEARTPIDAVPVVRCEHCKEAVECQLYGEHCGIPAEKGIFCEVWQTVVDKNGYCYQGAKMDGGAENEQE